MRTPLMATFEPPIKKLLPYNYVITNLLTYKGKKKHKIQFKYR